MALPSSGKISIGDVLREMERLPHSPVRFSELAELWLHSVHDSKFNAPHKLSDWYGGAYHGEDPPTPIVLAINPTRYDTGQARDFVAVAVTCNSDWYIANKTGEASVAPNSGSGNWTIRVSISDNLSGAERFGSFEVRSGSKKVTFRWSQSDGPIIARP